jgi:putative protease
MELLAPAGTIEHFFTALEAGADGVYVGAPHLNARNASRELRLEEIGAMAACAHERGKSLFVALNSLIRETDLHTLVRTLAYLQAVQPDGLIIQDLGIIELVHSHFPDFTLHGSTLMLTHNSAGVELLAELGCSRVVLARELSLQEIEAMVCRSPVEIEIFIHGAMCFSYSGGCLFSSYLGGKSGLRGNCVQPCRRKYTIAGGSPGAKGSKKKSDRTGGGYLFSMNDLEGLEYVPQLRDIGVASLKIEGRMRSATYVENVVRAYRLMIDAPAHEFEQARREGARLLNSAMGRTSSSGYFTSPKPKHAIAAQHSGNLGTYLGRLERVHCSAGNIYATIELQQRCTIGDRVRLHLDKSGDRHGFTIKELQPYDKTTDQADFQSTAHPQRRDGGNPVSALVQILLPGKLKLEHLSGRMDLFLVDVARKTADQASISSSVLAPAVLDSARSAAIKRKVEQVLRQIGSGRKTKVETGRISTNEPKNRFGGKNSAALWLRTDSVQPLFHRPPFTVDRFVLELNRKSLSQVGQLKRHFGRNSGDLIWALPPVVHGRNVARLSREIDKIIRSGFRSFQIAHLSQLKLFEQRGVSLYGDYTLNLLNSRAMLGAAALGLSGMQFCIEADRTCLQQALASFRAARSGKQQEKRADDSARGSGHIRLGMTVYGAPPLFVSRLEASHLPYNKTVLSPKQEGFVISKKDGETLIRPQRPFSLLPFIKELHRTGLDYLVIDISGIKSGKKELAEIAKRINGKERVSKLPSFNYLGVLE